MTKHQSYEKQEKSNREQKKRWTKTVYRSRHRGHQRLPSAEEEGAGKNDRKRRDR